MVISMATTNTLLESSSFVEQITKVVSWSLVHWDRLKLRIGTCRRLTRLLYSKELRVIYFPTNLASDLEPQNLPNHRVDWTYHPWKLAKTIAGRSPNFQSGYIHLQMVVFPLPCQFTGVYPILRKMLFNKKSIITSAFGWQKASPQQCVQRRKTRGGRTKEVLRRGNSPGFTQVSPLHLQQKKKQTVEWSGTVVVKVYVVVPRLSLGLNWRFLWG